MSWKLPADPVLADFDAVSYWLRTLPPERALAVLDAAQGLAPPPAVAPELPAAPVDSRPRIARDDQRGFIKNLEAIARGDAVVA